MEHKNNIEHDSTPLASPQITIPQGLRSEFLNTLNERGFLKNCSDWQGLDQFLQHKDGVKAYIGFDATANCLHVGSLTQIMLLRWLQKTGHKPIVMLGLGTTRVGDPSGKNKQRKMLEEKEIKSNALALKILFESFLDFNVNNKQCAKFVNNAEWLDNINWLDFLRDYGRHFSVNKMVKFDTVRTRLETDQPLSFLEFNYMVLQAFDFLQLYRREDCRIQLGGSDQWGNILCGIDLIRRTENATSFALTSPLLTNTSGEKMGKTATGAIWLSSKKLSSNNFWQFWRNTADADVGRFLRLYTELPIGEIERLERLEGIELNEAKKILANAVTTLCHGVEAAEAEEQRADDIFVAGNLSKAPNRSISSDMQHFIYNILRDNKLVESNSAARKLIRANGVRLDGKVVLDEQARICLQPNERIVISVGKKTHYALVGK